MEGTSQKRNWIIMSYAIDKEIWDWNWNEEDIQQGQILQEKVHGFLEFQIQSDESDEEEVTHYDC